jgi:hypothetical protein
MRAGMRLQSAVCDAQVIITRAPDEAFVLSCGGRPMVEVGTDTPRHSLPPGESGTLLGKRYVDDERGIEVLVTKGGDGTLSVDGHELTVKGAKPLPSSD